MIATLTALALASLLTAAYLLVSRRRGIPRLEVDLKDYPDTETALPQIAGLTGGAVQEGNEAVVYQDGQLLEGLLEAIRNARSTVHLESYVWTRGKAEEEFTALLCHKAKEGVAVRVLVDALGAKDASPHRIAEMRKCGVSVGYYHPINRFAIRRFNNRTHRKLLVVDGEIGFTFGHGIRDTWCGNAEDENHWRDTGVRLRGPLVFPLQVIFSQDWIEATGTPPLEAGCFVEGEHKGGTTGHIVSSSTRGGYSAVALLYMLAMASARYTVTIQNPYFAPDSTLVNLLEQLLARDLVVRLMVPGSYSDSPLVRRAGQHLYARLLQSGIEIHEYNKTFLHQKIVVVDGIWSHIGSTNFDARSLALNAEIGIGLLDKGIAKELEEAFEQDLEHCRKLTFSEWKARPRHQKFVDWCAYQLHSQI